MTAAKTNGANSVVEIPSHPGDSTPMRVHQNDDEHLFVLVGTARVARGNETLDAPAGTAFTLPAVAADHSQQGTAVRSEGRPTARSSLVRRLVRAKDDPAKQRIRSWLSNVDDERLLCLGVTSEDIAMLRGTAGPEMSKE
jgi:hypothetical protein